MHDVEVRHAAVALLFPGLIFHLLQGYPFGECINAQDLRGLQRQYKKNGSETPRQALEGGEAEKRGTKCQPSQKVIIQEVAMVSTPNSLLKHSAGHSPGKTRSVGGSDQNKVDTVKMEKQKCEPKPSFLFASFFRT